MTGMLFVKHGSIADAEEPRVSDRVAKGIAGGSVGMLAGALLGAAPYTAWWLKRRAAMGDVIHRFPYPITIGAGSGLLGALVGGTLGATNVREVE